LFLLLFFIGMSVMTVASFPEDQYRPNMLSTMYNLSFKIFYLFLAVGSAVGLSNGFVMKMLANGLSRSAYLGIRLKFILVLSVIFHLITLLVCFVLSQKHVELAKHIEFYFLIPVLPLFLYGLIATFLAHFFKNSLAAGVAAYFIPDMEQLIFRLSSIMSLFEPEPYIFFAPHAVATAVLDRPDNVSLYLFSVLLMVVLFIFLLRRRILSMEFK